MKIDSNDKNRLNLDKNVNKEIKPGKKTNQNSCRGICRLYEVNSDFRRSEGEIFKKYCPKCDINLISRYSSCPCCHQSFEERS